MEIHNFFIRIVQGIDVRENCRKIALKNVCGYALMLHRTLKFVKKNIFAFIIYVRMYLNHFIQRMCFF